VIFVSAKIQITNLKQQLRVLILKGDSEIGIRNILRTRTSARPVRWTLIAIHLLKKLNINIKEPVPIVQRIGRESKGDSEMRN